MSNKLVLVFYAICIFIGLFIGFAVDFNKKMNILIECVQIQNQKKEV